MEVGNTTEATTLLQQFIKKKNSKITSASLTLLPQRGEKKVESPPQNNEFLDQTNKTEKSPLFLTISATILSASSIHPSALITFTKNLPPKYHPTLHSRSPKQSKKTNMKRKVSEVDEDTCPSPDLLENDTTTEQAAPQALKRRRLNDGSYYTMPPSELQIQSYLSPLRDPDAAHPTHELDLKTIAHWSQRFLDSSKDTLIRAPSVVSAVQQHLTYVGPSGEEQRFLNPDAVAWSLVQTGRLCSAENGIAQLTALRGEFDGVEKGVVGKVSSVLWSGVCFAGRVGRRTLLSHDWKAELRENDYFNTKALSKKADHVNALLQKLQAAPLPGREGVFSGFLAPTELDTLMNHAGAGSAIEKEGILNCLYVNKVLTPILSEGVWAARVGVMDAEGRKDAAQKVAILVCEKKLRERLKKGKVRAKKLAADKGCISTEVRKQRVAGAIEEVKRVEAQLDNVHTCMRQLEDAKTHTAVVSALNSTSALLKSESAAVGGRDAVEETTDACKEAVAEVSQITDVLSAPLGETPDDDDIMADLNELEASLGLEPSKQSSASSSSTMPARQQRAPPPPVSQVAPLAMRYSVKHGGFIPKNEKKAENPNASPA